MAWLSYGGVVEHVELLGGIFAILLQEDLLSSCAYMWHISIHSLTQEVSASITGVVLGEFGHVVHATLDDNPAVALLFNRSFCLACLAR